MSTDSLSPSQAPLHDGFRFRVVMIYENLVAGKSAERFTNRLLREIDEGCDCSKDLWNFDVLAIPEMAAFAGKEAASANLIVISALSQKPLPMVVTDWIEKWVSFLNSKALIMLSGAENGGPYPVAHLAECDREVQRLLQEVFA